MRLSCRAEGLGLGLRDVHFQESGPRNQGSLHGSLGRRGSLIAAITSSGLRFSV